MRPRSVALRITAAYIASATMFATLSGAAAEDRQPNPLDKAIAALAPGQFATLETLDIDPTLLSVGSSGSVFGFTEDIKWDPISEQLFYLGSDHGGPAQFAVYAAATNTWRREARQPWFFSGAGGASHGYDHSAIDPNGRAFYNRPAGFTNAYRFDIDKQTWSETPSFKTDLEYNQCCSALEYFPELGGLVFVSVERAVVNAAVLLLKDGAPTWQRLASNLPMGNYHNFAEYNPVHQVLVFGGGNGSKALYKLDGQGKVTRLKDAPVLLGIQQSVFTVDPASGDYLVFTKGGKFYSYDVTTDHWSLQDVAVPIWTSAYGNPIHGVVATPLTSYGATLFVTCEYNAGCRVTLYRHSAADEDPRAYFPTASLAVSPPLVRPGEEATLSWSSEGATRCTADWTAQGSTRGEETVHPTATTVYAVTCSAGRFASTASVSLAVSGPAPGN
ncbi:MAG: hypothetical protein ACFB13_04430 [Kiloniellaceae bacterium]